jgi:ribonuclease VapC
MSRFVFDTSAILAIILEEPGADAALAAIRNALVTTVNLTEALTRCLDKHLSIEAMEAFLASHGIEFVDFGYDLARTAATLRIPTKLYGLSLGDRACLALAIRENATAVTADRSWAELDIGCKIELIR